MRLEERGGMSEYIDASSRMYGASVEAYRSINQVHHNDPQTVKVLVNIGSGRSLEEEPAFSSVNKVHTDYFRLEVQPALDSLGFDESRGKIGAATLESIRIHTEKYLKSPDVREQITKIAKQLVDIRRERSTWEPDPDRWERFCHGVEYACPVSTCQNFAVKYKTRRNLQDHLKAAHSIEPDELESFLDRGKRFPLDEVLE